MTDCNALLELALDSLLDGLAIFDGEGGIAYWNQAAVAITGYAAAELRASGLPPGLEAFRQEPLLQVYQREQAQAPQSAFAALPSRGMPVHARHKLGHEVPAIARSLVLRDGMGEMVGTAVLFHPAERLDALPHGEAGEDRAVMDSQADFEERLRSEFEDLERGGQPLGLLWVGVDQGPELRRTHGVAACQGMMEKVQRALSAGLRPAEEMGRWGEDEFLILAHERTPEMLASHAHTLAGLARTADFRWWGDRISITVSIGAAQAKKRQSLSDLLERARQAMETGIREGGNCVMAAPNGAG